MVVRSTEKELNGRFLWQDFGMGIAVSFTHIILYIAQKASVQ